MNLRNSPARRRPFLSIDTVIISVNVRSGNTVSIWPLWGSGNTNTKQEIMRDLRVVKDEAILEIDAEAEILSTPVDPELIKYVIERVRDLVIDYIGYWFINNVIVEEAYTKVAPACSSPYWCSDFGLGQTVMWVGNTSVTYECNNCSYQWTVYVP